MRELSINPLREAYRQSREALDILWRIVNR